MSSDTGALELIRNIILADKIYKNIKKNIPFVYIRNGLCYDAAYPLEFSENDLKPSCINCLTHMSESQFCESCLYRQGITKKSKCRTKSAIRNILNADELSRKFYENIDFAYYYEGFWYNGSFPLKFATNHLHETGPLECENCRELGSDTYGNFQNYCLNCSELYAYNSKYEKSYIKDSGDH